MGHRHRHRVMGRGGAREGLACMIGHHSSHTESCHRATVAESAMMTIIEYKDPIFGLSSVREAVRE
eukprot:764412-Hanusia_phi.AAC.2